MGIQNSLPLVGNKTVGLRTEYATLLPPGSKVAAYVGSIQSDSLDAYSASTLLVQTLNAGLARCRPGKGDVVVVLPGHTENVSTADFMNNLVAGTQILGVAPFRSGLMPTLTFTNTAATFLLDQPNCVLSGIKFAVGVDAVVNFIPVTGSGNYIGGCYFQMGTAAALDMQTAIIVSNGASDLTIEGNKFAATGTAVNTAAITASGTGLDNFGLLGNEFYCNCATNGVVNFTGTGVGINFSGNTVTNVTGTAAVGFRFTDTAILGMVQNNTFAFTLGITVLTAAITQVGNTNLHIRTSNNLGIDADALSAIVTPTQTGVT